MAPDAELTGSAPVKEQLGPKRVPRPPDLGPEQHRDDEGRCWSDRGLGGPTSIPCPEDLSRYAAVPVGPGGEYAVMLPDGTIKTGRITPEDEAAVRGDWEAVGGDLRAAMGGFSGTHTGHPRLEPDQPEAGRPRDDEPGDGATGSYNRVWWVLASLVLAALMWWFFFRPAGAG